MSDVSVVMAVRNGARYLSEALASIAAQTVPVREILLVDGGSTDGTRDLAEAAPGVTLLEQDGPSLADAYNTGIDAAAGAHVAFLSYDDTWAPRKLELQLAALGEDAVPGYCVCHAEFFHDADEPLPPGFRPELLAAPRPARVMETLLVRRALFDRVGLLRRAATPSDDVDWFARAQDLVGPPRVVAEPLLRKRIHAASTAYNHPDTESGILEALRASILRKREAGA